MTFTPAVSGGMRIPYGTITAMVRPAARWVRSAATGLCGVSNKRAGAALVAGRRSVRVRVVEEPAGAAA